MVASSCSTTTTLLPGRAGPSGSPAAARCRAGGGRRSARRGRSRRRPGPSRSASPGGPAAARRRRACRPPGRASGSPGRPGPGTRAGATISATRGGPTRSSGGSNAEPREVAGRLGDRQRGDVVDRPPAERHGPGLGAEPGRRRRRGRPFGAEGLEGRLLAPRSWPRRSSRSRSARRPAKPALGRRRGTPGAPSPARRRAGIERVRLVPFEERGQRGVVGEARAARRRTHSPGGDRPSGERGERSGTTRSGSKAERVPRPSQAGQAP